MHVPSVYFSLFMIMFTICNDIRWRTEMESMHVLQNAEKPVVRCNVPPPRESVDVGMFVPSPIPWEDRRALVTRQFLREGWNRSQVVLIYVLGTRAGERLETGLDTSGVKRVPGVEYLFTGCRDMGDEPDNPNGTSATTCKVYEACVHIAKTFNARYVWRGADDTYVNLKLFVHDMMGFLPRKRLYMGFFRKAAEIQPDLLLSRWPKLQELFSLYQWPGYMSGSGYLLSGDVAEFIGTLKIPPKQTWCEDIMVSFWITPFQITKLHVPDIPGYTIGSAVDGLDTAKKVVHVHYMERDWWDRIDDDGVIHI